MLPQTDLGDAIRVAERIRRSIEALAVPHAGSPKFGVVTASFGVSAGQVSAMTPDEMIASADAALYTAKRGGRNQVCPPPLRDATVGPARTGWAAALKRKAS
jgi:diguanylate cyclase (GGDEF)-like protein